MKFRLQLVGAETVMCLGFVPVLGCNGETGNAVLKLCAVVLAAVRGRPFN